MAISRRALAAAAAAGLFGLSACGGGSPATSPPSGPESASTTRQAAASAPDHAAASTPLHAGASAAHQAAPAGNEGDGGLSVTVTGGEDAGSYEVAGDVECTIGFISSQHVGVAYQVDDADDGQLRSLVMSQTPEHEKDPSIQAATFSLVLSFGPYTYPPAHTHEVFWHVSDGYEEHGEGSAAREGRVITATATTDEGVRIDVAATCNADSYGL